MPRHLCLPETIPVKCPFWATGIHSSTSAYSMLSHGCTPPCQMNVPSAIGKYIGNIKYRQYEKLSQRWKVYATCFLVFPSGTHSRHYWSIKSCFLMSPEWGFSTLLNTGLQLLPSTSRNGLSLSGALNPGISISVTLLWEPQCYFWFSNLGPMLSSDMFRN